MDSTNGQPQQSSSHQQDPRLSLSSTYNSSKSTPNTKPYTYDLSIPQPVTFLDVKTDDELFVETWLSKLGKINLNLESAVAQAKSIKTRHPKRVKGHLSIHQAKEMLKKCLEITSRLEATQKILKENVSTMCTEKWRKHTTAIGNLKGELTSIMAQFHNPEILNQLKYDLAQRNKKRATQKRKRIENKLQTAKRNEEMAEQHKKIDLWLHAKKEEAEKAKAEERARRDADCVLAEVTKKKTDTRKQLSLLASLVKLRNVREIAAKARGEKVPEEDNAAFSKTTETLVKLWENSMMKYTQEEQSLKKMLEENAKVDDEQLKADKEKLIAQQWDDILFGETKRGTTQLYWALTSAQREFEKFIAIRKSWDTFVAKDDEKGSKIPAGWVMPEPNPNLDWSCYNK